jgi:hypothetical protein
MIALGEQRRDEVFAIVEACVRMLLLSLVQREKDAAGDGEAGGGEGGREDAGGGAVEAAGGDVDCPRYASVGRYLP